MNIPAGQRDPSRSTDAVGMTGRVDASGVVGAVGRVAASGVVDAVGRPGAADPVRMRMRVYGIVQGVGFRPFVYGLAIEHECAGFVGNDSAGVFIEIEGDPIRVDGFIASLRERAPALARVERVTSESIPLTGEAGFRIAASASGAARQALICPDTATCADCLAEIFDPADRRYRYPFTNCTNCGPRFTIVVDVPYDRAVTTMATFPLCATCAKEYTDPTDRRFHAEPVCCPACGPRVSILGRAGRSDGVARAGRSGGEPEAGFLDHDGRPVSGDPIAIAADWLRQGKVLAVKGLGGYHLTVLADHEPAVAALRARKHRAAKPFAVMVSDVAMARTLVDVVPDAVALLTGAQRPVVLLARRAGAPVAPSVAPDNRDLGVLLPYTPLHHLLADALGKPFVLTSGNISDEPIVYRDDEARERLAPIVDGFLTHNRPIHTRADDSVVRVCRGAAMPIRRSRGYAPQPLPIPLRLTRPVLACGAELKNTFCVAKDTHAFVSQHIGDLENYETFQAYAEGIEHYCRLFGVRPEIVAHDLHPEYLSTKYAMRLGGVELVGVQHHHAHIAACLADNEHPGPVIGVAFDGLGFGADGTLWGGEWLLADLRGFERIGHLAGVPMPGGAAAVREPWRMAAAYLDAAYGREIPDLALARRHARDWPAVLRLARTGVQAPHTSSAGRLFDAVAALVGLGDVVSYEGQAAIALEQRVDSTERAGYPVSVAIDGLCVVSGVDLIRGVVADLIRGVDAGRIAARFHSGLIDAVVRTTQVLSERTGLRTVALSGGVFQNMVLLNGVADGLTRAGLRVLTHRRVPPNDGGISLGQMVVAGACGAAIS